MITHKEMVIRLGIYGSNSEVQETLVRKLVDLLELRVGHRISNLFPESELRALNPDDDGAMRRSLNRNVPEYPVITQDEFDSVLREFSDEYDRLQRSSKH